MVFEVRTRQKETNKLHEDIEELARLLHLHRISSVAPKLVGADDALFEQVQSHRLQCSGPQHLLGTVQWHGL